MDLKLQEKVAIITGASRGIGRGIAQSLANEGCHLVICARGEDALMDTANALSASGGSVKPMVVDILDDGAADCLVSAALKDFGRLDILVGNAGNNRRGLFADTTDDDWAAVMDLNFSAHARCARAAIPAIRDSGGGSIIFISSIFGREAGGRGLSIYNTSKSALISLAKIMALELGQDGIRVNTVAPGSIRFEGGSWDRRCKEDPEWMKAFVENNLPMGRFGMIEEVADVVTFIASPRASWISGACINVDGVQSRSLI